MPPVAPIATDKPPEQFLKLHGYTVSKIVQVWSGAESDFGHETILYLDGKGEPYTAVIVKGYLVCHRGWSYFDVEQCLPT